MAFDYAGKVRAMLAKADSAEGMGNEAEAAAYRNKAYQIMRDYRVSQEEEIAADPTSAVPTHLVIEFTTPTWELSGYFPMMLRRIAEHTGVRVCCEHTNAGYKCTVVGYDVDVRYTEFLWTSAYLMFSTRITPVWDENRSEAENIFYLRNAGIQRREIADRAWKNGHEASARSKVQRIYLAESKRRGEQPRAIGLGFDTKTYRESYANSFVTVLTRRLREARDAADSVGGGLVLHGRAERVDEAFYVLFPRLRPTPSTEVVEVVDPRADCVRCTKAASGYCSGHRYLKPRSWTQRDELAWHRRTNGASARAGGAAGALAADGVSIRGDHTRASRLDASGRAIEA